MRWLGIDLETYSSIDLAKSGVYAYASSDDFEILLFSYAFDDEPVQVVDLSSGENLPKEVLDALKDSSIIKAAFNANFERVCLSSYLKEPMHPESWRCTAVQAAAMGLHFDLESTAKILKLDEQKMDEGKELIRFFSKPCKSVKTNGYITRNLPVSAPDKWDLFKEYCKRDVEVERSIRKKLQKYPLSHREQELWELDQRINDHGISVDYKLVLNSVSCDLKYKASSWMKPGS